MTRSLSPLRARIGPGGALATLLALLLQAGCPSPGTSDVAPPSAGHAKSATAPTAGEALEQLLAGNRRFVSGAAKHPNQDAALRRQLAAGQHPIATIVACSDSRVPVELLFDQGLGDLFVVRVAGNVVGVSELGSIEYAVHHLHTPLVLVLGHEGCGAVTAALRPEADRRKEAQGIQLLLNELEPGLATVDPSLAADARVHQGVEANVRWSMKTLEETSELTKQPDAAAPTIRGAVYDLTSGTVRMLPRGE